MTNSPRVLGIDIETAPILAYTWGTFKVTIPNNMIVRDWHLLSFGAKWLGEKELIYHDQSQEKDKTNDKPLLKKIHALLNEADMVLAHNGDTFDVPKIKSRMFKYKIRPFAPFKKLDTLKESRKTFGFTSNKLEFISEIVGCPKDKHHAFPGFELWQGCMDNNPRAWAEMKKYNLRDVVALEKTYLQMRPWMEGHPNVANYGERKTIACPKCGGEVGLDGYYYTQTGKYHQFQCKNKACGGWARGRKLVSDKFHRSLQLSN